MLREVENRSMNAQPVLFQRGQVLVSGDIHLLPMALPRKVTQAATHTHERLTQRFAITEASADGEYVGFAVADGQSPLFCLDSFLVVHNSPKVCSLPCTCAALPLWRV
jgi:hypothetical protein